MHYNLYLEQGLAHGSYQKGINVLVVWQAEQISAKDLKILSVGTYEYYITWWKGLCRQD